MSKIAIQANDVTALIDAFSAQLLKEQNAIREALVFVDNVQRLLTDMPRSQFGPWPHWDYYRMDGKRIKALVGTVA